jgi:hypothetical protein
MPDNCFRSPAAPARGESFIKIILLLLAALSVPCFLTGCQSPSPAPASPPQASLATRNNCYSLLYQLLDEQKDVSFLRFIKPEHRDVKNLVKRIAAASGAGAKLLKQFARADQEIRLDDIALPPGEASTRDAIAATKKKALLGQSGDEFELTLLLTQTEALNYAWHLAEVAAKNESQADRARALAGLGDQMADLYHQVFALILSKTKPLAANTPR